MELGELAHEREADARAPAAAGRRALHLVEPVEHALDLVVRDPDPGVLDRADEAIAAHAAAHRHGAGARLRPVGEPDGVREEVQHDLLQLVAVHRERRHGRVRHETDRDVPLRGERLSALHEGADELEDVHLLEPKELVLRVEPGEVEERVDVPQQPLRVPQHELEIRPHLG